MRASSSLLQARPAALRGGPPRRPPPAPDELVNRVLGKIPNVLCLIGASSGDEWNGMTASWVTQVAMEPVLVAVSVDRQAVPHRLISEGRAFTVRLWSRAAP